jgi:cell fate (sporulation/competence/biofilm development) regulator YlbF (YheA/YmcA/DUF963 family)
MIVVGLYDNPLGGPAKSFEAAGSDDLVSLEHVTKFKEALNAHEKHVKYLELKQSLKYIETIRQNLAKSDYKYGDYEQDVEILQGRENHELEDIVFGFIPADKAAYFQNKELFGADVNAKFQSAAKDIQEAGNCHAHGNYTASVFHLMRVLEIALHVLANAVGVTFPAAIELENWKNIIDKIDSAIKAQEQLPKSTQKSEDLQFYSEAAKEFRYFKDAWRNHVSHSRVDYEVHDATKIMEHVKDFMQHLATKLKE